MVVTVAMTYGNPEFQRRYGNLSGFLARPVPLL